MLGADHGKHLRGVLNLYFKGPHAFSGKFFSLFFFYFLCFLKEIVLNDRSLVFVLDFSVFFASLAFFFCWWHNILLYTIVPFFRVGIVK